VGPTSLWARRSIWKFSFAHSPTGTSGRVHDSESLEWPVSFESEIGLFPGSTTAAVVTLCSVCLGRGSPGRNGLSNSAGEPPDVHLRAVGLRSMPRSTSPHFTGSLEIRSRIAGSPWPAKVVPFHASFDTAPPSYLEQKLQRKHRLLSELMEEHVTQTESLGSFSRKVDLQVTCYLAV